MDSAGSIYIFIHICIIIIKEEIVNLKRNWGGQGELERRERGVEMIWIQYSYMKFSNIFLPIHVFN